MIEHDAFSIFSAAGDEYANCTQDELIQTIEAYKQAINEWSIELEKSHKVCLLLSHSLIRALMLYQVQNRYIFLCIYRERSSQKDLVAKTIPYFVYYYLIKILYSESFSHLFESRGFRF